MSSPSVVTRGVSKVYSQGTTAVTALDNVTFTVSQGEFTVLAGPSGSGKTTLLNLLGGLDRPTEGTIVVEGQNLTALKERSLAQVRLHSIGFIFQAYNLIPVLTAFENAEYVLMLQGVAASKRRRIVRDLLNAVGLDGLEHRRPNELSGGQQQRVAVARAIAASPRLVLADEPTANLDTHTGEELIELMHNLNREREVTFVFSTHDLRIVERAERLIQIRDGQLISDEVQT